MIIPVRWIKIQEAHGQIAHLRNRSNQKTFSQRYDYTKYNKYETKCNLFGGINVKVPSKYALNVVFILKFG